MVTFYLVTPKFFVTIGHLWCSGILYDLDEKVITEFSIYPYLKSHRFFKYAKSLFSLEGFKRIK